MKKTNSNLQKLLNNFRNLVPYIGVLLVTAGIIGLLFIQKPLERSQDNRSEASVGVVNVPGLEAELRTPLLVNKTGEITFHLDRANKDLTKVFMVFNIENRYIKTPKVEINPFSGFAGESIEIQQINDGFLVKIVAVKNDIDWENPLINTSLVKLTIEPTRAGLLSLNFDKDLTNAESENLAFSLSVPLNTEFKITHSTDTQDCGMFTTSEQCSISTASYCAWYVCASECHPRGTDTNLVCPPESVPPTTPPATQPPATDEPIINDCNEECNNNGQCEVNMRCYRTDDGNRCRLAENPSSISCSQAGEDEDISSCNEYCENNAQCDSGLTCYEDFCRNPENPQDNRCADPTEQEANAIIKSCGQTCSTSKNCAKNLKCYEGECRLSTNVSSTSCSAVTKKTITNTYAQKAKTATDEASLAKTDTPIKKGDDLTGSATDFDKQNDALANKKVYEESYQADETLLDLFKNLIKNSESRLPFFVILFGILLLVLSILAAVLTRIKKARSSITYRTNNYNRKINVESHEVKPGNNTTKELLKTLENQSKD